MKPTITLNPQIAPADTQQLDLFGGRGAGSVDVHSTTDLDGDHRSRQASLASPSHELELRPGRRARVARQVSNSLYIFKGFEVDHERAASSSDPAQLADGAASSPASCGTGSLVSLKHATRTRRTAAPAHSRPRRILRVAQATTRPHTKSAPAPEFPCPALRPLSSAALSYVFVAVTLACTFLV